MAASRVLEAVRWSANGVNVGTRGGVQRSVRVYEREGGEVDPATADRVRRYMCLAIIASPRVFHQAETHIIWLGSVLECFWWWTICGWLEDYCIATASGL